MRITIVTGPFYPLPPAPCGGVEILWHGLARYFVAEGHQVTMVCRGHPSQKSDEIIDGVRFIRRTRMTRSGRLGVNLLKDMIYSLRLLPLLPPADILTTNVFWLPVLAPWLRRGVGQLIVNVHRFPKKQLALYRRAARVATCSSVIKEAIAEQAPDLLDRTRVFPNPIDIRNFSPPSVPRPREGPGTILFTGRVHPEKGLEMLLEAYVRLSRELPGARLLIVGPARVEQGGGGEDFVRRLKKMAGTLPLEVREPIYDRAKLADLLRGAHCYVYPTLAEKGEALPAAPLEAMATGLVPVVSKLACFRDYLIDGETGLYFDHRSADPVGSLTDALRKVLVDSSKTEAMSRAAVAMAANYSYERVTACYLADFEQLLSGAPLAATV